MQDRLDEVKNRKGKKGESGIPTPCWGNNATGKQNITNSKDEREGLIVNPKHEAGRRMLDVKDWITEPKAKCRWRTR